MSDTSATPPSGESTGMLIGNGRSDAGVRLSYPSSRGRVGKLRLGDGYHLRSGTVVYDGARIGERLQTGHHVVIREDVIIGDDVSVWSGSVIDYGVVIGDRVRIHTNCYIAQYSDLESGVFLAPGVTFANDLYPGDEESAARMVGPHICRNAQLGVNVTVLPGVEIGADTIVGAGSVVTRDLPPGVIAYGNPARPRGSVTDRVPVEQRLPERSGFARHAG